MIETLQKVAGAGYAFAMMLAVLVVFIAFVVVPAVMVLLWLVNLIL